MVWGWSIPQGRPDGFAAQLRAYGEQYGVAALTESEVPFPDETIDDLGGWVLEAAYQIGAVTTAVTGHSPYFAAPVGGGSRAVFLLTMNPPLPPLTIAKAIPTFPRLLSSFTIADPRGAVFVNERLAAGASELRDFVSAAWRTSANSNIGWPAVKVAEVEAGRVDPWTSMIGED